MMDGVGVGFGENNGAGDTATGMGGVLNVTTK